MIAPLALTVLLARGFVVDVYWHHPPATFTTAVDDATTRNDADARLAPDDDTPHTAPA